jgi:hypothetical protein
VAEQVRGVVEVERRQRQLDEPSRATKLVPQAPQPVIPWKPVGAIGGDDEDRQVAERDGERREELERRLVGPLQVVEDDERVAVGGEMRQRGADRLEQRRAVGLGGRRPQLGQQQREVRSQRPALREAVRTCAQVLAQRGHHGAIGRRSAVARGAGQHEGAGRLRDPRRQPALAHAGLAAEQHQRPGPPPRPIDRRREPCLLLATSDQHAPRAHGRSLRWPPRRKYGIRSIEIR